MSRSTLKPLEAPSPLTEGRMAATEPSQVLKTATELFVARTNHSPREITLFRELALNLLPQTDVNVRRRMSSELIWHPSAPRELMWELGRDEDAFTAFPILHHMDNLPDDLLVKQIENGPDGLRKTIAERPSLSPAVVDALVRLSGAGVIESLLLRDDLVLTDAQTDLLLKRPDGKTGFGRMMRYRAALTETQLLGHFLHLTPDERIQALATAELFALREQARRGHHPAIRPVFKQEVLNILRECAMAPGPELFSAELCYALRLPRPFIDEMIGEDNGQTLTVCLKALGFKPQEASAILIRILGERLSARDMRDLVIMYRRVSLGAAMTLVDRWIAVEAPDQAAKGKALAAQALDQLVDQVSRDQQTADREKRITPQPTYQESPRSSARRASGQSTGQAKQDYPWEEIQEIENILKFG